MKRFYKKYTLTKCRKILYHNYRLFCKRKQTLSSRDIIEFEKRIKKLHGDILKRDRTRAYKSAKMLKDFSKSVLHNTATIMTLKFNAKEEAKAISEQMFGLTENDILSLGEIGQGYVKMGKDVLKLNFFQVSDINNNS